MNVWLSLGNIASSKQTTSIHRTISVARYVPTELKAKH